MIEQFIPEHVLKYLQQQQSVVGRGNLVQALGIRETDARYYLRVWSDYSNLSGQSVGVLNQKKAALIELLKRKPLLIEEIAATLGISIPTARLILTELEEEKYNLQVKDDRYELAQELPAGAKRDLLKYEFWQGGQIKFGAVADTHLCSKFERLDVLNVLYDIYHNEGIRIVYHGGNYIDGECNFNKYEVHTQGVTAQIDYFIREYPYRDGIVTKIISGDDHEGWYAQRERLNIGEYMETKAKKAGRDDLIDMGYLECDIELEGTKQPDSHIQGSSWMRLMHAGGGTSYALSYTPQKIVESLQGGEKPSILLLGHFHKLDYCYPREVHTIQLGCTQDQTTWMRKKKIQAMVGGCIIELNQAPDGTINRCKVEYITFYDKKFYLGNKKYWR